MGDMIRDEVVGVAKAVGFRHLDSVAELARRTVLLRPNAGGSGSPAGSRLGGLPALPRDVAWPSREGKSLAFVAQINLEELPSLADEGFPVSGLLSFFYDAEQSTWGFDPGDAGSFAVLFAPDTLAVDLRETWPRDVPEHARYRRCDLVPETIATLPPWESLLIDRLGLAREQLDLYMDVLERLSSERAWGVRTLLGGYPDQIQGDMMLECELVSAGLYCGDATAYQDPRLPLFKEQAVSWRQLLQIQSCDEAGMTWGDVGCLYYWIRDSDLRARRFDAAWMVLQCG